MFTRAVLRRPGPNAAHGLTTSNLGPPVLKTLEQQHRAYREVLEAIGLETVELDAEADFPDAYFVEDTAVVTPDIAVITRPGARDRRGEERTIEPVLARFRKIDRIRPPGILDGGDVLMINRHFFIGLSERTNVEGAAQLGAILERYGHTWETVPVGAGLHLKSSVNAVADDTLLLSENLRDLACFKPFRHIVVDPFEEYACNSLRINQHLILPAGFPVTRGKLEPLGLDVIELDVSEVRKMDGGLTCLSLRF